MTGRPAFLFAVLATLATPVLAAERDCPLPGQAPMLVAKMYFGQGRAIRADEWNRFLAGTVTPRFPDGFTVYDARGQWTNPRTRRLGRERTKVVEIATPDTEAARNAIIEIAHLYREKFRQQSVGIVTATSCALF